VLGDPTEIMSLALEQTGHRFDQGGKRQTTPNVTGVPQRQHTLRLQRQKMLSLVACSNAATQVHHFCFISLRIEAVFDKHVSIGGHHLLAINAR